VSDVQLPELRVDMAAAPRGNALDEYRHLGEDLRHYGILRLARLTLLLGTTGAMVTALASETVRAQPIPFMLLKVGGLVVTLAFAIMDYRSGAHWMRLQQRSNVLAQVLGFELRPTAHAWNPLSTTGASRLLHAFLVFGWIFVLLLPLFRR
jgi:hypothetical protein